MLISKVGYISYNLAWQMYKAHAYKIWRENKHKSLC